MISIMYLYFFIVLLACVVQCSSFYFATWDELHRIRSVDEFHDRVTRIMHEFACEDCRDHFVALVESHPFPVEKVRTVKEARIWFWLTHNLINIRLEKEWAPLAVLDKYSSSCSSAGARAAASPP